MTFSRQNLGRTLAVFFRFFLEFPLFFQYNNRVFDLHGPFWSIRSINFQDGMENYMLTALAYAMPGEIESIIGGLEPEKILSGVAVYRLRDDLIAYCGGIGKVNAAMSAQLMIDTYHPDRIINAGVAGCFENCEIGRIVLVDRFLQYDVDTTAIGDPLGMVSTVNMTYFPTSNLDLARSAMDKVGVDYSIGLTGTGECFVVAGPRADFIRENFNVLLTEMEGGAIAQVCYRNNVPFMALKSVSDTIGFDSGYEFNYPNAMKNLNQIVLRFVDALEEV